MTEPEEIAYISELLFKQLQNQLSSSEEAVLEEWMKRRPENEKLRIRLTQEENIQKQLHNIYQTKALIDSKLADAGRKIENTRIEPIIFGGSKENSNKTRKLAIRISIAASLILIGSFALYFYTNNSTQTQSDEPTIIVTNDVAPGGNKATLTLADGQTINLSDNQNGIIIDSENITYNDGSTVSHHVISTEAEKSVRLPGDPPIQTLALTTPKGGQYQVTLSDGTKVWLNAASSLKYPNQFADNERLVELTGEAYFEVMTNKKQPFIVKTANQEVEVLGTHFNINAYTNESTTKTSLLEGSVRVSPTLSPTNNRPNLSIILSPGQQSILVGEKLSVTTANLEESFAWKNGYFIFNDAYLSDIMKQLERWYDIQVDYKTLPKTRFNGSLSRKGNLSEVMNMLEKTGEIKFKIENKTIKIIQSNI